MGNDHEAFIWDDIFLLLLSILSKSERTVLQIGEGGTLHKSTGRWPDLFKNQQESMELLCFLIPIFWTHFGRGEV